MDASSSDTENKPKVSKFRRRKWLWIGICAFLVFLVLLFVILGLTVFKPRHAITKVDSVRISGMRLGVDFLRMRVDLNVTLDLDISVKNPNPVSFRFGNSTAYLYYRGDLVGEAPIPAGAISSRGTLGLNISLAIMAGRVASYSNLFSDVRSGTLPLETSTRISGRVTILNIFKRHVVSYTHCDVSVDVVERSVEQSRCIYRTKI